MSDKTVSFQPHLLNSSGTEERRPQVELLYNFFRQMAQTSNANLIRNANHLLALLTEKRDNEIVWHCLFFFFQKTFSKMKIVSFIYVSKFDFKFYFIWGSMTLSDYLLFQEEWIQLFIWLNNLKNIENFKIEKFNYR